MSLKTWFLGAATIGRAAAARCVDIPLEDFRAAADDLGYGPRLTYPQIEEVVASLGDPEEEEEDETEDDDEDDDDDDDEEQEDGEVEE